MSPSGKAKIAGGNLQGRKRDGAEAGSQNFSPEKLL
jgi:hypothetical protein